MSQKPEEGKMQPIAQRVVTFLDRKELDFLDGITKDIFFSRGIKVARCTLLKEILDIFLNSCKTHKKNWQELLDTIIAQLKEARHV